MLHLYCTLLLRPVLVLRAYYGCYRGLALGGLRWGRCSGNFRGGCFSRYHSAMLLSRLRHKSRRIAAWVAFVFALSIGASVAAPLFATGEAAAMLVCSADGVYTQQMGGVSEQSSGVAHQGGMQCPLCAVYLSGLPSCAARLTAPVASTFIPIPPAAWAPVYSAWPRAHGARAPPLSS